MRIKPGCESCDTIQGIHNQVWACGNCNSLKKTKGLYEFFREKYPNEKKFYDMIPTLLEKKYLKTIFNCHQCAETLDKSDLNPPSPRLRRTLREGKGKKGKNLKFDPSEIVF